MFFLIPLVYVIIHAPDGDKTRAFDGMSTATVSSLVSQSGHPFEIVTKAEYDAAIIANTPPPPSAAELQALRRVDSISEFQHANAILIRAILLTALDEINLLRQRDRDRSADVAAATSLADLKARWAARSSLGDRTGAQLKAAVQNKINAGTAD